ncbi:Holliday junction resolvase RuvX [Candidatus Hydrogenosomobacter endosymbioticus]|uniref:Putative pre-16S rRNA nuclease n=1 Tax=Candidatus Hydrogenosomobacter endosymbioticus TaxID=2558174 RepID=A0ABM7V9Z6_9PROT|nr:Holliday junction resolvase RuvX [Candidatus Hydrogenosomobacter endosymbioticus]BDB96299.1 Holliday junction resolvase RuvX [Candidatus Hydrogenosomobacter endosymbioticus]
MTLISLYDFAENTRGRAVLGIDWGSKHTGIAVSDADQKIAAALVDCPTKPWKTLLYELERIIHDYKIGGIVIGWPIDMDGGFNKNCQSVKSLSENISKSVNINICLYDERLSSRAVAVYAPQKNTKKKVFSHSDKHAAAFFLQGALDLFSNIRARAEHP